MVQHYSSSELEFMHLLEHLQPLAPQEALKIAPWGRAGAKPRAGGVMPPSRGAHIFFKILNTAQTPLKFNANIGEFI